MSALGEVLSNQESELLEDWFTQMSSDTRRSDLIGSGEIRAQGKRFIELLRAGMAGGGDGDVSRPQWDGMRQFLTELSTSRAVQGFTPIETAMFVFSFKRPLFARLRRELGGNADGFADEAWRATELLDSLGLLTTESYQKARESVIQRQQQEMLELSTPVVKLWEGVLALPVIGTLDSERTQVVMESLLQQIVQTSSRVAIIDITGVPMVDTLVAQHLLKTVTAARLMGADCIISGIRPQIAQTIVHLGVNLGDVTTKATLADAFALALQRSGRTIQKIQPNGR